MFAYLTTTATAISCKGTWSEGDLYIIHVFFASGSSTAITKIKCSIKLCGTYHTMSLYMGASLQLVDTEILLLTWGCLNETLGIGIQSMSHLLSSCLF